MSSWIPRSAYIALLSGLALGLISLSGWSASNFIRVPLGSGASIGIPQNWVVLSDNQRASIDALVAADEGREFGATLGFAAELYDERSKPMALVNARLYPGNPTTQADMRRVTPNQLRDHDVEIRRVMEAQVKARGDRRVTNGYGFKTQDINGLYVLAHEYQHSGFGDAGPTRVRVLQVWRRERSFAVTLTYRERDATMLLPIIDYMATSENRVGPAQRIDPEIYSRNMGTVQGLGCAFSGIKRTL